MSEIESMKDPPNEPPVTFAFRFFRSLLGILPPPSSSAAPVKAAPGPESRRLFLAMSSSEEAVGNAWSLLDAARSSA
eukprot:1688974-Rhodomonas_salina.1